MSCEDGTSGFFCQCKRGYKQHSDMDLTCVQNDCETAFGDCAGRAECLFVSNAAVPPGVFSCQPCTEYPYNSSVSRCLACVQNSVFFGPEPNLECRPAACVAGPTICSGRGVCLEIGQCACYDPNFDGGRACASCLENHVLIGRKCVFQGCITGGTECAERGFCDGQVCQCFSSRLDSTANCSSCKDPNALIGDFCIECMNRFQIVHGTCIDVSCRKGERFDYLELQCVSLLPKWGTRECGMVVAIVVLVAVAVFQVCAIAVYQLRQRGIPTRRNSILSSRTVSISQRTKSNDFQGLKMDSYYAE
eukprot:EST47089.1 Cysteine-rich membrane protein 2 [Spironucleus salmonicida]